MPLELGVVLLLGHDGGEGLVGEVELAACTAIRHGVEVPPLDRQDGLHVDVRGVTHVPVVLELQERHHPAWVVLVLVRVAGLAWLVAGVGDGDVSLGPHPVFGSLYQVYGCDLEDGDGHGLAVDAADQAGVSPWLPEAGASLLVDHGRGRHRVVEREPNDLTGSGDGGEIGAGLGG